MSAPGRPPSLLTRLWRFLRAVVERFNRDQCLLHASALTYTSLLSLVPLLALMFAVLKGLGVQRRLEPLLLSQLSLSPEATEQILAYIDHTNVGTLGALGAAALLTTVLSVLGTIELSFNNIWRVRRGRTWFRKATDYLSTVLLTPFLLLAAVALTSSLHQQTFLLRVLHTEYIGEATLWLLHLAPVVMNVLALGILYAVMPNRRPYIPAIVVGAVLAGGIWQPVQWGYVSLQVGVARYNAIYGAMAQLPVTLVGLYLSWIVVLIGAQLAAVFEFGTDADRTSTSPDSRWAIALHLLLRAAEQFRRSGGFIDPQRLALELQAHSTIVADVAARLCLGGLLARVDQGNETYVLARDPAAIQLADLSELVDSNMTPSGCDQRVRALVEELRSERQTNLGHRTVDDLQRQTPPSTDS